MALKAAQSLVIVLTILSCISGVRAQACSNDMEEQDTQWPSHYTQPTRNLVCPSGWTQRGSMCYQEQTIPQTWANAQKLCQNYGGHLPVIYSYDVNKDVASYISQDFRAHWIGLSEDSSGGYVWADGLSANLSAGRWADLQPDVSYGACVTADLSSSTNLWSFDWCYQTLPFVCQRAASVEGTFQCLEGTIIYNSMACDGVAQCSDESDELIDCPSQCVEYVTGSTGSISSGTYSSNSTCYWIIEAPQGQKVILKFTSFETELEVDIVDVFVGGSTLDASVPGGSFSGPLATMPTVYSTNNFMIVRLSTDQDEEYSGFAATWTTEFVCNMAELTGYMQEDSILAGPTATSAALCSSGCLTDTACMAAIHDGTSCTTFSRIEPRTPDSDYTYYAKLCPGTNSEITLTNGTLPNNGGTFEPYDTIVTIASPFYPVMYPNGLDMHWYIHAPEHLFLTLEMVEIDLTEDDSLVIYNGNNPRAEALYTFNHTMHGDVPWTEMYRYIIPTGNEAFVHFRSKTLNPGSGFHFTAYPGCQADLTRGYGYVFTPNTQVTSVDNYTTVTDCEFKLTPPDNTADITLAFTEFDVDHTDAVTILDDPSNVLYTFNNTDNQAEVTFAQGAGQASVKFTSDAVYTATGFLAEYTHDFTHILQGYFTCTEATYDCPGASEISLKTPESLGCSSVSPTTGTNVVDLTSGATGSSVGRSTGDSFHLSCDAGYTYLQDSLEGVSVNFTFVCERGEWTDTSGMIDFVPDCAAIYCGSPYADVANGFVANMTSAVTDGVAEFGCADGYYINYPASPSSSTCSNGTWENIPTCDAGSCPSLTEVASSTNTTLNLDGLQQGSVVEVTCETGYNMQGAGRLLCTMSGSWSEVEVPSCELSQCLVPWIANGAASPVQDTILYGETVTVTCDSGYDLQGSTVLECGLDGAFNASSPTCTDINECATANGGCEATCSNFPGGFNCTCNEPAFVVVNDTACVDFDECTGLTHICDDECTNSVGSYSCACDEFAYELFTDGALAANTEDGLEDWNLYRVNQSCRPSTFCTAPTSITNGCLEPSSIMNYYYGQRVTIRCDVGHMITVTQGGITTEAALVDVYCNQGGGWTLSGEADTDSDISFDTGCEVVQCPALNLGTLENPPVVSPSGAVDYGTTVTLTCTVSGMGTFQRSRTCVYNADSDAYELLGDELECGVIDCGILNSTVIPGSDVDTTFSGGGQDTTYGATFTFGCLNNLTVQGQSSLGGQLVTCSDTGLWDLGSLHCGAGHCDDPGTPAGATQTVTSDGYVQGATVTLSCDRTTFVFPETGTNTVTLTCLPGPGGTSVWSDTVTECIDTTAPVTDCSETTIYLSPMDVFSPNSFNATDNSGLVVSYNFSHPNDNAGSPTIYPGMAINTIASSFSWLPLDGSGNDGTACDITVVPRVYSPVVWTKSCSSLVVTLDDLADNTTITVDKTLLDYAIASESDYTVTIEPTSVEVSAATLDSQTLVTVSATHADPDTLSSDTCILSITVKPEICREFALATPAGGNKTCVTSGPIMTCTMTCDAGYSFVGESGTNLTYTCEDGTSDWERDGNFTTYVPDCAASGGDPSYVVIIDLSYENYVGGDCSSTMQTDLEALDFTTNPNANCDNLLGANPTLANTITAIITPSGSNADVTMEVKFHNATSWTVLESCAVFVQAGISSDPTAVFDGIFTGSCAPTLVSGSGYTSVQSGLECDAGLQLENYGCYPCPSGTFLNGTTCSYCSVGEYQNETGQTFCHSCPAGYWTETTGATDISFCYEECPEGWTSLTGVAPCDPCPIDTYWTSATNCTNCPGSNTTVGQLGATSIAECQDLCPVGEYSTTTYGPCTPCPAGYYTDSEGSQTCLPCSAGEYTASTGSTSSSDCVSDRSTVCGRSYCSNNGECYIGTAAPALYCDCDPGYLGYFCEIGPLDLCDSDPCYNGATCSHTTGSDTVTCACVSGFGGDLCENDLTDDCASDPCGVLHMCHDTGAAFDCYCNNAGGTFYTGDLCENSTDVCSVAGQECYNGAECSLYPSSDGIRRYCNCTDGYEGPQCETDIDECALYDEPCYGRGNCTDQVGGFSCACENGYSGDRCETVDDLCTPDPCSGFGQCCPDVLSGTYSCACDPGYGATTWTTWSSVHNGTGGDVHFSFYQFGVIDGDTSADLYEFGIPIAMECREVGSQTPWYDLDDDLQVPCVPEGGLYCRADQQDDSTCATYEVRYLLENPFASSCSNIDDCAVNQCLNNGTCSDDVGGFTCACEAGFEGARCQHDVNGCLGDPCLNGATCVDTTGGYTCQCAPGYEGSTCSVDTDDCTPSPCNATGTASCTDLVDGYTCTCSPGFTGAECQNNIDECVSQPCFNNGTCTDDDNGYTCNCASGWEGDNCDVITTTCTGSTCQNSGVCYDLLGTFFCACPTGTRGSNCETVVDVCADANPCLNGGTCSYAAGAANCTCPAGYTGSGCEFEIDFCAPGVCQNGGTCTEGVDAYECRCAPGYEGTDCETNTNECADITCVDGTCIDAVNFAYCYCDTRQIAGFYCQKPIDIDYDLEIRYGAESHLIRPFILWEDGNQLEDITFLTWVYYKELNGEGRSACLHDAGSLTDPIIGDEVICFDHVGVTMSINNDVVQLDTTATAGALASVNNGQWHQVAITWHPASGSLKLFIDNFEAVATTYQTGNGAMLPKIATITLGDGQFRGTVHRVKVLNTTMTAGSMTLEPEQATIMQDWEGYQLGEGVLRVQPSEAALGAPTTADVGPDVTSCPEYATTYCEGSGTELTWTTPTFDATTNTENNYNSGTLCTKGVFDVVYVGEDDSNGAAVCNFPGYVKLSNCSTPYEGSMTISSCTTNSDISSSCEVSCPSGMAFLRPGPNIFTCGPSGAWDPENPFLDFFLPSCAPLETSPTMNLQFGWQVHIVTVATNTMQLLSNQVKAAFITWATTEPYAAGICADGSCSNADVTSVLTDTVNSVATIEFTVTGVPSVVGGADQVLPSEAVKQGALQDDAFLVLTIADADVILYGTFYIEEDLVCSSGYQKVGEDCVSCTAGTYYDPTTQSCIDCAIGTYQNNTQQTSCVSCPTGQTTARTAAIDVADCYTNCSAGSYYDTSSGSCMPCGRGFYQGEAGQTFCLECGFDMVTVHDNATSCTECYDDCTDGYEPDVANSYECVPCPIGEYRTAASSVLCETCPVGFETPGNASTLVGDCSLVTCPDGQYRVGVNPGVCQPCPLNSYRSGDGPYDECTLCGDPEYWNTQNTGNVDDTDCFVFCGAGEYRNADQTACELCPVGTYKEGGQSNWFVDVCTDCPTSLPDTLQLGSTSQDNCTTTNCNIGQVVGSMDPTTGEVMCDNCPEGTYQPNADPLATDICISCGEGYWTRGDTRTSQSDCERYCEEGQQLVGSTCELCSVGYYKNNSVDVFGSCLECPGNWTTYDEGAVSVSNCSLGNCVPGNFFNLSTNECEACPVDTYNPDYAQTSCISCVEGFVTYYVGSDSIEDCLDANIMTHTVDVTLDYDYDSYSMSQVRAICEDILIESGTPYINFTVKTTVRGSIRVSADVIVDIRNTTQEQIAESFMNDTNVLQLDIGDNPTAIECDFGKYLVLSTLECEKCPVGTYQNMSDVNLCRACNTGYSTVGFGSLLEESCRWVCPAGQYSADQVTCTPCPIGYYKEAEGAADCTPCPWSDQTTASTGSTSYSQCIGDCSAGQFRENQRCSECAIGTYSTAANVYTCQQCPEDYSTEAVGADSASLCKDECELNPDYCQNGGICNFGSNGATCTCIQPWVGEFCELRGEYESDTTLLILAIVGGICGFILMIFIFLCCCYALRKRRKESEMSSSDEDQSEMYYPMGVAFPFDRLHRQTPFVVDNPWATQGRMGGFRMAPPGVEAYAPAEQFEWTAHDSARNYPSMDQRSDYYASEYPTTQYPTTRYTGRYQGRSNVGYPYSDLR